MNRHIAVVLALTLCTSYSFAEKHRGIGVYPGDPKENYLAIACRGLEGNRYYLDGNSWKMSPLSTTHPEGEHISSDGFDVSQWMGATVPSTNYMNFVYAGKLDEPNYSDNIYKVDHNMLADDFWYRTEFKLPDNFKEKSDHVILNFDGINWKAFVFLNGKRVGKIEGAFKHGRFDVSDMLNPGKNVLAVKVVYNAHPGKIHDRNAETTGPNGGVLGADNPTFHASIGWDWMPTIPGRNCGIWDNVYLSSEGPVSLSAPLIHTGLALPDTLATVTPSVVLLNNSKTKQKGLLKFTMSGITVEKNITVPPLSEVTESFFPDEVPELSNLRIPLWWPNGLGSSYLHSASFIFTPTDNSGKADTLNFNAGLRQIDFTDKDTNLKLYVNGKRMVPLGGNWGFPEANLRYGKREYDTAVEAHRNMNFNIIRNWVGQTGNDEFYDACDRNGVMVWQDFWLANPVDGPNPDDEEMFMDNANQMVSRVRRHPSILLYCGRNEGNPPVELDEKMRQCVDTFHKGMLYISHSAAGGVSGFGPYNALRPHEYYTRQSGKTHSERGMPAPLTIEGARRTLPESSMFSPLSLSMAQHDFTANGAQGSRSFVELMESSFGPVNSFERFSQLAQWISYDGYRAMFESTSASRQGLLLWMSHSAWPSMVWQTYDYYFEPLGAFFGSQKGCEPLHIQYNPVDSVTEIVNRSGITRLGLKAQVELLDIDGKSLSRKNISINSGEDTTLQLPAPELPENYSGVYFIRQILSDARNKEVSRNFYVMSTDPYNFRQLNELKPAKIRVKQRRLSGDGNQKGMEVTLKNESSVPAMLLRLNLLDADGDQILPVVYSDNYMHLMPGETRTVKLKWDDDDTRSDVPPHISLTGLNFR